MSISQPTRDANLFELKGHGLEVHYATTSIAGVPTLGYHFAERQLSFRGDQIRLEEGVLGRLVTVVVEEVPDLHVVTFTLILPEFRLRDGEDKIDTLGIWTTGRTSIGGPALLVGQLSTYRWAHLTGVARAVVF